jgi:hypothetical protein
MEENNSPEFIDFAEEYLELDKWLDKREMCAIFKEFYPDFKGLSSHRFTKMIKDYSEKKELSFEDKSTGGNYMFIVKKEVA